LNLTQQREKSCIFCRLRIALVGDVGFQKLPAGKQSPALSNAEGICSEGFVTNFT